ncbi:MAG TPA: T9SS type A sorting domain-containing protein [Chitinophagaceae bacterium]|nr:T9SS type A sorting domain-containing protein [Chitinophagaceae bacterium]
MKQIFTLLMTACFAISQKSNSQILLNELYTDPGAGKHEFFELYNASTSSLPVSVNNYTIVTFFEISGQKGFYVMDLPNLTVAAKDFFVGSAALPFNYQGITNSTASDFSWNSAAFTTNSGSLKKWVQGGSNVLDGNLNYDQSALPANFNDFFFRRTGAGSSYSIFLYNNGTLVNTFLGGTGGQSAILSDIINMPKLFVDMSGASPDFMIDFSGYGSNPVEYCNQEAGSDNGFIREADGACGKWVKSSSGVQHTPKASNGTLIGSNTGAIAISSAISRGTSATGSVINYNVVSGPTSSFPVEMQIYLDNGSVFGKLDGTDTYVTSKTEAVVSDGPFYTTFFPYDANILIVVKTSVGCLDKIVFIPNALVLSVNFVALTGNRLNDQIKLNWVVEENEATDHFEIERSIDNGEFAVAGLVFRTEKSGTENYTFTETIDASHKVLYRLKIQDSKKNSGYSKTLVFGQNELSKTLKLYGNPVSDRLVLNYDSPLAQAVDLKIYDMAGHLHMTHRLAINKGNNMLSLPLNPSLKHGVYIVEVSDGSQRKLAKFIKQ